MLNTRGVVDLALLITPLEICQKLPEPSYWGVTESYFIKISELAALVILL